MAPTHDQVVVACNALRSDATKWVTGSDEMAAAATAAQGQTLGRAELGWIAEQRGVTAAYTTLQGKIATLLTGADREFDALAVALRTSADNYEREDAEGAHLMDGIEMPR